MICMALVILRKCEFDFMRNKNQLLIFFYFHDIRRGQLGLGSLEPEDVPVLIEALAGIKVRM